jgi:hypothetical protein
MDAIEGEDAADFGPRIFDLSPNGCSFRIKVEKQGDFPTYVSSKFALPKAAAGLDASSYEEIYNNVFDLESYLTVKSYDELKEILNTHYFCTSDVDDVDETPVVSAPKVIATPKPAPAPVVEKKPAPTSLDDDSIADLLKGLED